MKYLDAKSKAASGENKMMPGTRPGQRARIGQTDPQLLTGSRTTNDPSRMRTLDEARDDPTPRAEIRELAEKLGVDLATVKGTGKDGEVLQKDIKKAADDAKKAK